MGQEEVVAGTGTARRWGKRRLWRGPGQPGGGARGGSGGDRGSQELGQEEVVAGTGTARRWGKRR